MNGILRGEQKQIMLTGQALYRQRTCPKIASWGLGYTGNAPQSMSNKQPSEIERKMYWEMNIIR